MKILKEDLKIPKEFTYNIILDKIDVHLQNIEEITTDYSSSQAQNYDKNGYEINEISGKTIYESSDIKAKSMGGYILIIALVLIIFAILFRKSL